MRDKRDSSKAASTAGPADSDESPKYSKRDGKPATERPAVHDLDVPLNPSDNEKGRRRRLQDPLPLEEAPHGLGGDATSQQHASLEDAVPNAVPVNPTYVPRSGYYFQHDDRTAPSGGRNNKRKAYDRSGWIEPRAKARYNDRFREASPDQQNRRRDDRRHALSQIGGPSKSDDAWTHDKFLESQAAELEARKKSVTDEKGIHLEGKYADHEAKDKVQPGKLEKEEDRRDGTDRRSDRRHMDVNVSRTERDRYRGDEPDRGRWMDSDRRSGGYQHRGGYGRFSGGRDRPGVRSELIRRNPGRSAVPAEKWTHDMFEEINRSPTPKQDDSLSQIEALLTA